jgi:hypothetical protein
MALNLQPPNLGGKLAISQEMKLSLQKTEENDYFCNY